MSSQPEPDDRSWTLLAWLIVAAAAILTASSWPGLPYFLDSFYHLSVIRGFQQAGGPVLHAFWEAAPQGRPHLYPPLFHLLFLPASWTGIPFIQLARFWSWLSFPLLLLSVWLVFLRLFPRRLACLALAALATPYSFFLGTINYLPATCVLIASMVLLLAVSRSRWLAGGIALAAAFWLHAGLPWLLALSLLLFGLIEPSYRKTCWAALALGLALASPWFLHTVRYLSLFRPQPRGEDQMLEAPLPWLLLGIWGFLIAWRKGGIYRFLPVMAVSFIGMAFAGYKFRFLATQGLFPWLLLAGVALDRLAERIRPAWAAGLLLAGLALLSPSLHFSSGRAVAAWGDTALTGLSGLAPLHPRGTGQQTYFDKFMNPLTAEILRLTGPGDLIYSNVNYLSGMLTAATGRACTNQMLREMEDRPDSEKIPPARLIVWLKDLPGKSGEEREKTVAKYGLEPAGETEIAYLFLNPRPEGRRRPVPAVLPWWAASFGILLAAAVAARDLSRPS